MTECIVIVVCHDWSVYQIVEKWGQISLTPMILPSVVPLWEVLIINDWSTIILSSGDVNHIPLIMMHDNDYIYILSMTYVYGYHFSHVDL